VSVKPLKKGATYDDLARVPEHFVAEMFDGELYASPRPALPHARAAVVLEAGSLAQIAEHHGERSVRALPFDAVELELRALWS
jgi:hypothetical protein